MIERNQIENTPFWLIGNEEIKYHLVLGKHRLTSEPIEKKDAKQYLKDNIYTIIIQMIAIIVEHNYLTVDFNNKKND